MTKGDIKKKLFLFIFPIAIGNILQQLYNLADIFIVGHYAGTNEMAALGCASNAVTLLINLAIGLNMGTNVLIANYFGAKDNQKILKCMQTAILTALGLGIGCFIVGTVCLKQILVLMNVPEELMQGTTAYLRIYLFGICFVFLYNIIISILQAVGDSRTPFFILIFSTLLNVFLDIVMVKYLHRGIQGAALATVVAELICCFIGGSFVKKVINYYKEKIMAEKLAIGNDGLIRIEIYDWEEQKKIFKTSMPAVLQRSAIAIGVMMMQSLINQHGVNIIAGFSAATKVAGLVTMPVLDIGNSMATYTAQNMGARKQERVHKGVYTAVLMNIPFAVLILFLSYCKGEEILSAFINQVDNTEAIVFGLTYLKILSVFQIIQGILQIYNGVNRGLGDVNGFMVSYFLNLISRVVSGYILVYFWGIYTVAYAWPIGWLVGLLIGYVRYKKNFYRKEELIYE